MLKNVSFDKLAGITLGNYSLERFIGQSKIGPTFLARTSATSTYLIRFLNGPMYAAPREHDVYLEQFQYLASQIVTLHHPYILPLLDFGVYRGFPYLVSPHIPLRSLRTRIEKNGVLNTFTVGRYLDQITTALEYAHEHALLHGGLSVDSVFIRLDGQLVVADIGVRSLLELSAQDTSRNLLLEWSEGFAPEQLLGRPISPATDVYALGVVVYYLLTGAPVYEGSTLDEIAQQHLYATIPSLNQWRGDLPAGLYGILARALAKDPAQRFHQPGAFANAYHSNVISTNNRTRLPFAVSEAPGQVNQLPVTGAPIADPQFGERVWSNTRPAASEHTPGLPRAAFQSSLPHSLHGYPHDEPLSPPNTPRPGLMHRLGRRHRQRNILIAILLILLVIASSVLGIVLRGQQSSAVANAGGQVMFFTGQNDPGGPTNSLHINIHHLDAPPAGNEYRSWIINNQTEQVTNLGRLIGKNQSWSVTFDGANTNLLAAGEKLEITREQGVVSVPTGAVVLAGTFPAMSFQHIQHLLVSYDDTPGKIGILMGMLKQTHLLDIQAAVLQSVSSNRNAAAIGCVTQSMLDIIEGVHGTHYQPLARTCARQNVSASADGFGLLGKGYLASAEEHASLALSQKDATSFMHQHAAMMNIAISNISGWLTTIVQDVLRLRANLTDLSSIQQITALADDAYHGVDANGDGQINPVLGEAGAMGAYQQGQLMATLSLAPGA